jgi:hypothetical protein
VFLNFAFDKRREYLYLSLVASVVGLGFNPRTVLEVPVDTFRLERLRRLIKMCRYSIHDLSAVQVTAKPHGVPRFNIPFELGLAVAVHLENRQRHSFRLMESKRHRLTQSLSDLNGFDPFIHDELPAGVFRAVRNMFAALRHRPVQTQRQFEVVYDTLVTFRRSRVGRGDPYTPTQFGDLVTVARAAAATIAER